MKAFWVKRFENYFNDYPFFALPNLSSGIARIVDLGGTFADHTITFDSNRDDFDAIRSDWQMVGKDMIFSLEKFETLFKTVE